MKVIHESETEIFLLREPDPDLVTLIQTQYNVTRLTARIIANRGLETPEEISRYLAPSLRNLPDPFLFREMPAVVERLYRAITTHESVMIYGDYDTDGITSTALLINFFNYLGLPVRFYIPNRFTDGYGLNESRLLQLFHSHRFTLLITVDCGTANEDAIISLQRLGVDTIVTDHHKARERPGKALGVLNPSIPGCTFPDKNLSGVGVAFFLLIALRRHLRQKSFWEIRNIREPDLRKSLDLVAIGTIADMVPIRGINRILVHTGLRMLSETDAPGLATFLKTLGLQQNKTLSPWEVAFQIAPRFNAAGRMDDATPCVTLLTTQNAAEAFQISKALNTLNAQRQQTERNLLSRIDRDISLNQGFFSPYAVVLWGESWHEGVIGIGASKLVERFNRPVVMISFNREKGKGSLRGIPGVDIFEALTRCRPWLVSYGGHAMAGGLTIHREHLPDFCQGFSDAVQAQFLGKLPKRKWDIDALIEGEELPFEFFRELARLEPFGIGNPSPLLALRGYRLLQKRLLKEKHIRVELVTGRSKFPLQGIAFNAADRWPGVDEANGIVGVPNLNVWNGSAKPQIIIRRFL